MTRRMLSRRVPALVAAVAMVGFTLAGFAVPADATLASSVCTGGVIADGTYTSLEIGPGAYCQIPDGGNVRVNGGLKLDPGAILDQLSVSTVRINGNVSVGEGAILGLGCTVIGMECPADSSDTVLGNIVATNPETMYIDGVNIGGNVVSTGGGGENPERDTFAFKDNTVKGNVTISGWTGFGWIGMIRNTVNGVVRYTNNTGHDWYSHPNDANEIVHNTINGGLICSGNSPAAQFGDAVDGAPFDYRWNVVKGKAVGECADLVAP